MINGHGNDIHSYGNKIVADFSTNVFNNPETENIINFLKENVEEVRNYPDCNCTSLRSKFANHYNVSDNNVLVCNGSTESFYLVAHLFKGKTSVIFTPSFSEYEDACKLYNHKIEFISNKVDLKDASVANKIVWLGNPNNPDSKYYSRSFLKNIIAQNTSSIFVIDEAYIDLCSKGETIADLVNCFDNLIVIKSFTKLYAIPGVRLGFVVANNKWISALKTLHMPWAVNVLAQKAGEFILDNLSDNLHYIEDLLQSSVEFQDNLNKVEGFKVTKSFSNYFLVEMEKEKASDLKDFLVREHGLLIRDASNFRGVSDKCFRVASQGYEKDLYLIQCLQNWYQQAIISL